MRSEFKRLGEYFGAASCEVKPLYDEDDNETEKSVAFRFKYDGSLLVSDENYENYAPYQKAI